MSKYSAMTDDEFLSLGDSVHDDEGDTTQEVTSEEVVETPAPEPEVETEEVTEEVEEEESTEDSSSGSDPSEPSEPTEASEPTEPSEPAEATEADPAKAFFAEVMKPFKANGKEFTIRTPEEAIKLMQMGAGYGRKMQEIQPVLKTAKMLQKHDLLDESKLSFLIDINAGKPEAIQKLLKDKGIDPLDLNTQEEQKYVQPNYAVPVAEIAFESVLDELKDLPKGRETIRTIVQTWDAESIDELGKQRPQDLKEFHKAMETGVYQLITEEMDRQTTLGNLPVSMPFLRKYEVVGEMLMRQEQAKRVQQPTAQPTPLATRVAQPTPKLDDARVRSAAAPKSTPRRADSAVDLRKLSDDEFLKSFEGRF